MIEHISYSAVERLLNCPRGWFYHYVLGQKLPAGDAASFGKTFDALVAHRLGLGEAPAEPMPEGVGDAVDLYLADERAWRDAACAQRPVECNPGQWMLLAEEMGADPSLPWPLVGYLDLDREFGPLQVETVDLKTSSRAEYRWGWSLQGTLYSLFHPVRRAARWSVHVLVRTKTPKLVTYGPYYPTKTTYRWAMNLVADCARRMRGYMGLGLDEVTATPYWGCEFCAGRNECEAAVVGRL